MPGSAPGFGISRVRRRSDNHSKETAVNAFWARNKSITERYVQFRIINANNYTETKANFIFIHQTARRRTDYYGGYDDKNFAWSAYEINSPRTGQDSTISIMSKTQWLMGHGDGCQLRCTPSPRRSVTGMALTGVASLHVRHATAACCLALSCNTTALLYYNSHDW
jgi:hypothetical protein